MRRWLRLGIAAFLAGAAGWELLAVVVLRRHRFETGITGEGPLCSTGPYRLSRHPINVGLLATAVGFAAAFPSPATLAGCGLFALHLAAKTEEEELWLEEHYGTAQWLPYADATPRFLPQWLGLCLAAGALAGLLLWWRSGGALLCQTRSGSGGLGLGLGSSSGRGSGSFRRQSRWRSGWGRAARVLGR